MKMKNLTPLATSLAACLGIAGWLHAPAWADAPADRYKIDAGANLVADLRTGLVWQHPISPSFYTWDAATAYCRGLRSGATGFRLPSFKELISLVDPMRRMPALDVRAFPNASSELYWSASNRSTLGPAAVSFVDGSSTFYKATDSLRVRCVR
jgi:hypothetical protein